MSPRTAGLLVSLFAVLASAAPALAARPPAPGAPGASHTWAPADKHGFGTAHQLAGQRVLHAAPGVAERGLLPRPLARRAFRGLQFAVTDGRTFVDREVVDDDPRHIEPVAPGVTARASTPLARLARVPPGHRERRAGG